VQRSGSRSTIVVACAVLAALLAVPAAGSAAQARPRVTFVGDSVPASISYVAAAQAELNRGMRMRLDLEVCRRLVQPSCPHLGRRPTTALQAVRSYGSTLGRALILDVGYNEGAPGYAAGLDQVVRTALAQGAKGVVWVTLREAGKNARIYRATNAVIRNARARWKGRLYIADWALYSRGKPWFGSDGLHLTPAGARELAAWLRPYALLAANGQAYAP
jgi:hypothetical protein